MIFLNYVSIEIGIMKYIYEVNYKLMKFIIFIYKICAGSVIYNYIFLILLALLFKIYIYYNIS